MGCGANETVTLSSSRPLRCSRTFHCRRRSGTARRPFTVSAVTGVGIRRRRIPRGVFSRSYSHLLRVAWVSCSCDGRHISHRCLMVCRNRKRRTLRGAGGNRDRGGHPICGKHGRRCDRRAGRRLLAHPGLWPSRLDVGRGRIECARRLRCDVDSERSSIVDRRSSIVTTRRSSSVETRRSSIVKSPAWIRAFENGRSPIDDGRSHDGRPTTAAVAAALSGFAALVFEVAWTRLIAMIIGPTTYAFALMAASFIVGIAIGSTIGVRLARRPLPAATA